MFKKKSKEKIASIKDAGAVVSAAAETAKDTSAVVATAAKSVSTSTVATIKAVTAATSEISTDKDMQAFLASFKKKR